jgi:hypothetical protein
MDCTPPNALALYLKAIKGILKIRDRITSDTDILFGDIADIS